jgi:ribosome-binding protein aMBF1 (putative translation factor)
MQISNADARATNESSQLKDPKDVNEYAAKLGSVFGENLRRFRFELSLSQRSLAKQSGLSAPLICRIEQGHAGNVQLLTLASLALTVGGDVAEMLTKVRTVPAAPAS